MKISNRQKRIITASILVPLLILLLYLRGYYLSAVALILVAIAMHEEFVALRKGGFRPAETFAWIGYIIFLPLQIAFKDKNILLPLIALILFLQILSVLVRKRPELMDILVSAIPIFTVALPGMSIISLINIKSVSIQLLLLISVFTVSIVSDTFAYAIGIRYGRHKLCPLISPKKTIEGAIAGLFGGVLAMVLTGSIISLVLPDPLLPNIWQLAIIGFLGAIVSACGDLFASLVKRACGIKDFGKLFPGHGGVLDRGDSIFFMAAFMYCIKTLFFS